MNIIFFKKSGHVEQVINKQCCSVEFFHSQPTFPYNVGDYDGPTVNWGALGSVSTDDARTYAAMIIEAADQADMKHKKQE